MVSRFPILKLALILSTLLAVAVLSAGQDAGVSKSKKPYTRNGSEVTLSGTVSLTGKRPKPRKIDTSADPACTQASPNLATEWVSGHKGKLANVFVYVKSAALDAYAFEMPDATAILEHKGCRFVPHLLGLRVGQQLVVVNSDVTTHNTHPTPKVNPEWNRSQSAGGDPITSSFKRSEVFIPFKCNQHPWEKAYVGVFDHPFFAITDADGNYRIEGLPPGQYTVVAWHELFGEKTLDLTFVAGELRDASFTFDAEQDVSIPR
jgi:plastocyanin